jgi:trans-aconitate methyltransferase
MAMRGLQVDAVDISEAMMAVGKALPGGDAATLRWFQGPAESASIEPPYGLVTAGESIHWMDWETLLPRLRQALYPEGQVAIVVRNEVRPEWYDELLKLIVQHSHMKNYRDYDLVAQLQSRGVFQKTNEVTVPAVFTDQPVEEYIESFFSRSSLSPDAIGDDAVRSFREGVRELIRPRTRDGRVHVGLAPTVIWGTPLDPSISD